MQAVHLQVLINATLTGLPTVIGSFNLFKDIC